MIYIGFVGSSESHWTKQQKTLAIQAISNLLTQIINQYGKENITFVSGGCKKGGIDIWAEIIADSYGLPSKIFPAEVEQWEDEVREVDGCGSYVRDKGYKSRNIDIANSIDILFCVDPKGRQGGGGQWTMKYAQKKGKEVHHVVIP